MIAHQLLPGGKPAGTCDRRMTVKLGTFVPTFPIADGLSARRAVYRKDIRMLRTMRDWHLSGLPRASVRWRTGRFLAPFPENIADATANGCSP